MSEKLPTPTKAATDLILTMNIWQKGPVFLFSSSYWRVFADEAKIAVVVLSPPWLPGMVESR